jgi:hypothetical protein
MLGFDPDELNAFLDRNKIKFYLESQSRNLEGFHGLQSVIPSENKQPQILQEQQVKHKTNSKKDEVSQCFAEFKNLCPREISLVVMKKGTIKMVIRKKTITVIPCDLGLKHSCQAWKFIQSAAIASGELTGALNTLNKTTDRKKNNQQIKTAISRLNQILTKKMGLKSKPIVFDRNIYRFIFNKMIDEELGDQYVSDGDDALNYAKNYDYDNNNSYLDEH